MEIERMLEYLKITSNIFCKREEELEKIYLENKEKFAKFIDHFYNMFLGNGIFRIAIFEKHEAIRRLILNGQRSLFNEESKEGIRLIDLSGKIDGIFEFMDFDKKRSDFHNLRIREIEDCKNALLFKKIGVSCEDQYIPFSLLIERTTKAGECYYAFGYESTEGLKEELLETQRTKEDGGIVIPSNRKEIISLCNNPYFLYFANSMLNFSSDINDSFVDDVDNIVNASLAVSSGEKTNETRKYAKIAKNTRKIISKIRRDRLKEDRKKKYYFN